MKLHLRHGRHDPDANMEDWGFDGPVLEGVESLACTKQTNFVVFETLEAMQEARKQTGWTAGWDPRHCLVMPYLEDMVECLQVDGAGIPVRCYYGDWSLEQSKGATP